MISWFPPINRYVLFVICLLIIYLLRWMTINLLNSFFRHKKHLQHINEGAGSILNLLTLYGVIVFTLFYFKSSDWMLKTLFKIGSQEVSFFLIILVFMIVSLTNRLSKLTTTFVFPIFYRRYDLDRGVQFTFDRIFHYAVMVIAIMVALSTVGFQLSALTVFAGIVGVGIGFGLQNITSNFISGIILLFERPIKVGDRVVINDIIGDVEKINMRATIIKTLDNEHIIVPNSYFLEEQVINRSYSDELLRLVMPIGVAYGSDVDKVRSLLLAVAEEEHRASSAVVNSPKPFVNFKDFGDSSLDFELFVWINDPKSVIKTRSNLNFRINRILSEHHIEIPFPQQDIHLRSVDNQIIKKIEKK